MDRGRTFFPWGGKSARTTPRRSKAQNVLPCVTHSEDLFLVHPLLEGELIAIDILSVLRRGDGDVLIQYLASHLSDGMKIEMGMRTTA